MIVYKLHNQSNEHIILLEVMKLENLVEINAVLSDENMIRIIEKLAMDPIDVNTLANQLELDQAVVLPLIQKLKGQQVVKEIELGDGIVYALNYFLMQDLSDYYAWLCNKMAAGCRECD